MKIYLFYNLYKDMIQNDNKIDENVKKVTKYANLFTKKNI